MDCQMWWVKISLGQFKEYNGLRDEALSFRTYSLALLQQKFRCDPWIISATTYSKTLLFHRHFCLLKMCEIPLGLWFRLPLWHVYGMKHIYHIYFVLWMQRDFSGQNDLWFWKFDDISAALGFCWGNYLRWMTGHLFFSWTYLVWLGENLNWDHEML